MSCPMKTTISHLALKIVLWISPLFVLMNSGLASSVAAAGNGMGNPFAVSFPPVAMAAGERVVGIEYDLRAAVVVGVRDIRSCWDIHVYNGDELKAQLQAQALFLSAGISKPNLSYFDNFALIREDEPEPGDHLFDIKVKLTITDDQWDKIRYVTFSKNQLLLKSQ
jgi:hypothetical protein